MSFKNIQEVLGKFKSLNILIIGDVMIDAYLWGKVERISPEAPVPVVTCSKRESRLGGAANVALNIQAMGANPILCSVIGNDDYGDQFLDLLKTEAMPDIGIIREENRRTPKKTRVISSGQQLLRVDDESTTDIEGQTESAFINNIKKIIDNQNIDAIIYQDYDKGSITNKVVQEITETANNKNIPTLVDPKKRHFDQFNLVTLFKPNFKELIEGTNQLVEKNDFETILHVANVFRNRHGIKYLFITLSEMGVLMSSEDESFHLPAEIRDIADVSGAGDTVISIMGLCMAIDMDMRNSARLANIAGGLVCEKVGVVPITPNLILKESIELI